MSNRHESHVFFVPIPNQINNKTQKAMKKNNTHNTCTAIAVLLALAGLTTGCINKSSEESYSNGESTVSIDRAVNDNTVLYQGEYWDKDELTDTFLEQMEEAFPMEFGDMMYFTGVSIDGDYLVYDVYVDEDQISIQQLKDNKAQAKKNITVMMRAEEDLIPFLQAVGKGLAYKYIGIDSEMTCTIRLTPSEVKGL